MKDKRTKAELVKQVRECSFMRTYAETVLNFAIDENATLNNPQCDTLACRLRPLRVEHLTKDSLQHLIDDCWNFLHHDLEYLGYGFETVVQDIVSCDLECAAQHFYFTQNRHGVGFWDGLWPLQNAINPKFKDDGTALTEVAHSYGSTYESYYREHVYLQSG